MAESVAEVVPLKQGLKQMHLENSEYTPYIKVAEVVPLKQGLKHIPRTFSRTNFSKLQR